MIDPGASGLAHIHPTRADGAPVLGPKVLTANLAGIELCLSDRLDKLRDYTLPT